MWREQRWEPYCYQKAPPQTSSDTTHKNLPKKKRSRLRRLAPTVLITVGSLLIANVAWPILSYQLTAAPGLRKQAFISPLPDLAQPTTLTVTDAQHLVQAATSEMIATDLDYTNARNWFPDAQFVADQSQVTSYQISIPSLDIKNAHVIIGGEDLDNSLIHYPGTANPGQPGAPVIFGHSVLRAFYNPDYTNPKRYISIFSKIMTLEKGDDVIVDYDGIRYTYEVRDKLEVQPDDIAILEQRYNNRELKLITCVPEGTYLRRGVIIAQLVDLE